MAEKRVALIIASYEYQDPDLRQLVAPAQDAEALARVLEDPGIGGFEVQSLLNEPSYKVNEAIEAFFTGRKRDDLLLLYFSGHGVKDEDGQLYFSATNTRRRLLRSTGVSANFVNDVMRYSRSRRQVLLLDCCYSGAFARGMVAKAGKDIGTKDRFAGRGRVVLTASDAMQYAFEGDDVQGEGARSVFTRVLVHGLETGEADLDRDGHISLDELYEYVHDRVTDETPQQRPGKWDFGVQGKIIIARSPAPPVPEASLPGWITEALASGAYSARLAAVGELAQLSQGQDQPLAAAARAALERLSQEDENLTVRGAASGALGVVPTSAPVQEIARPPRPRREPERLAVVSPDSMIWEQDGKEMVRVPAGKFLYGNEKEERELPEFWIDKTPVTNAEYARFVAATGHKPPQHWKGKTPPEEIVDHPVVNVSRHDAVAYAEWAGKRLPTEEEWEKAARGTDGREYPWGDWEEGRCNTKEAGIGNTTPVGQYSPDGDSPYGCVDMAGNVLEWTATGEGGLRVLRGGSFDHSRRHSRCAYRGRYSPGVGWYFVGFRVVVSPISPASASFGFAQDRL